MADIVGRGQARLLLPTSGEWVVLLSSSSPPSHENCPTPPPIRPEAPPSPPSGTTLPPQGPILEERKCEDRRVCMWGQALASQQLGSDISTWVVKGQVCEQRINGVPDRWRSVAW